MTHADLCPWCGDFKGARELQAHNYKILKDSHKAQKNAARSYREKLIDAQAYADILERKMYGESVSFAAQPPISSYVPVGWLKALRQENENLRRLLQVEKMKGDLR